MAALTVAIVGMGHNGRAWAEAYERNSRAEVVALCDLSAQRLGEALVAHPQAKGYANLGELLERERPHVLSIHTPDHLHAGPFVQGLEAGCHVLCEKPMANSMGDLVRMVEAARRSDRKTHIGQVLRFNPLFAEVKRLCEEGVLGEIFYLEADYIHNLLYQGDDSRINPAIGNINWYLEHEIPIVGGGVHQLDLLRWFVGQPITHTCGFGNSIAFRAMKNPDCMVALFHFAGGAVAKVAALYGPVGPRPPHANLAIYGTRGTIRGGQLMVGKVHDVQVRDLSALDIAGHPYDPQVEYFLDCIQEDRPSEVDALEGARSAAAALAAAEAIRTGEMVEVEQFGTAER